MTLASIYWDASPTIFSIGSVQIRWYGLLFALAFIAGYQIMDKIFKSEGRTGKQLDSLTVYMIIGTVAGARLGHCLFYDPAFYLANPVQMLYVWKGGLASHGAAIGILTALWLYCRRQKNISYLWLLDRIGIVVALSGFFIRTGNFFNSEIIGRATALPWGVIFASEDNIPRHPSQVYEALVYLGIFLLLYFRYKKAADKDFSGRLFGLFLTLLFSARFLIEFTKENQSAFEAGMALNMGQLLSLPLIAAGIWLLARKKRA